MDGTVAETEVCATNVETIDLLVVVAVEERVAATIVDNIPAISIGPRGSALGLPSGGGADNRVLLHYAEFPNDRRSARFEPHHRLRKAVRRVFELRVLTIFRMVKTRLVPQDAVVAAFCVRARSNLLFIDHQLQ